MLEETKEHSFKFKLDQLRYEVDRLSEDVLRRMPTQLIGLVLKNGDKEGIITDAWWDDYGYINLIIEEKEQDAFGNFLRELMKSYARWNNFFD